ncbi:hypothetical protein AB0395_45235 [Streptosporangium sp. NPDC051023]|uniref:hypothetical protein n=1 Tax=Streptosporangium sp. NPDC051023 TaxID=3155410 RepID=UPI00344D8861
MEFRNRTATFSAVALLTAGLLVGTAAPAQAVLDGCTFTQVSNGYMYSKCTTGSGEQRLVVGYVDRTGGPRRLAEGSWVGVNQESSVGFSGTFLYWWIEKRG